MAKILFFEFTNKSPHIETAFEIAYGRALAGDEVHFLFCGHDTSFREFVYPIHVSPEIYGAWLPERKAAKLTVHHNLHFQPRVRIKRLPKSAYNLSSLSQLKKIEYKRFDLGMAVASSLISYFGQDNEDITPFANVCSRMIQSAMEVHDFALETLEQSKPDQVVIFNGRFHHPKAVMRACETLGIPFLIHERGCNPTKYFLEPFMPHDRLRIQEKTLKIWQEQPDPEQATVIARDWFEKRRKGADTDTKSYTKSQQPSLLPEIPRGRKVVTYFNSSNDEYSALGDLFPWKGWKNQIDAVLGLIDVCKELYDTQLVIRLHPNLASKSEMEQAPWRRLRYEFPWVLFIEPKSPFDSYALAERSDAVVTCGSKMGIEATYWKRPSILLGPCYYDQLNVTYAAYNRQEISQLLKSELQDKFSENILAYGFYWATFGYKHIYYQADSYHFGKFFGVNLQEMPKIVPFSENMYYKTKKALLRFYKKS